MHACVRATMCVCCFLVLCACVRACNHVYCQILDPIVIPIVITEESSYSECFFFFTLPKMRGGFMFLFRVFCLSLSLSFSLTICVSVNKIFQTNDCINFKAVFDNGRLLISLAQLLLKLVTLVQRSWSLELKSV